MEANPSAESLLSLMTWAMWGLVGLCALFYFASSYLFEILAQKHDEPRWMAWVPIANGLLMMRLVGWEKWFWLALGGYALGLGGMLLPGALKIVGMIAIFPLALGMLALGLAYFPVLATKRGLGVGVGLWVVVPQFVPPFVEASVPGAGGWVALAASLAAGVAFLKIVFHDGRPKHGPHPLGYVLTLLGVAAAGLALQALPSYLSGLLEQEDFRTALAQLGAQLETTPLAGWSGLSSMPDAADAAIEEVVTDASTRRDPTRVEIPDHCPEGTRERNAPQGKGRAWWCELPVDGRWVRHGPSRTWHDNGYLESEGVYDHGRRNGTWIRYWRSGGRRVQAQFRDDVQHGWMYRWDVYGKLESTVRYADGEVVAGL